MLDTPQDNQFIASPLEKVGFNSALFRDKKPLSGDNPYGKKSTVASENTVEEGLIFRDNSVPTEALLNRYTINKNAALALTRRHYLVACDTTSNAITITLPDARTMLGHEFIIFFSVDGGNTLTVSTDNVDTYQGIGVNDGNVSDDMTDASDFLHIIAVTNDKWLVLSEHGGSFYS